MVEHPSCLPSAEVFQAWWWKPTDYGEAVWTAVVPGIRSSGEEMREGFGVFSFPVVVKYQGFQQLQFQLGHWDSELCTSA